jgi:L-rhamnose mutarotase
MRVGFKMKVHANKAEEYKRRHDTIWPELKELLKQVGISDYSIFLDEETYTLFGVLTIKDTTLLDTLPCKSGGPT